MPVDGLSSWEYINSKAVQRFEDKIEKLIIDGLKKTQDKVGRIIDEKTFSVSIVT